MRLPESPARHIGSVEGLSVVVVGAWMSFPYGMANTIRARLLAEALHQAGARVHVLCLQVSEWPPNVENRQLRGTWRGVSFEYATWTTVRSASFMVRRAAATWGWVNGASRLFRLRREGRLDVAYLWFWARRPSVQRYAVLALLRAMNVPVVLELCELPWPLREEVPSWQRRLSPLLGASGVVSISAFLSEWVRGAAGSRVLLTEIPIVVDVNEQAPEPYPAGEPVVVFSASAGYDETLLFIRAAMERVWKKVPSCRLVVTGTSATDPASLRLLEEPGARLDHRITLAGYLPRPELMQLYARAHALLIPLFDDARSRARFPTKIGEYLAAGRPVVTTAIGEVDRFLTDGVDAVVSSAGDPFEYGEKLARLLIDPESAAAIGRRGRELAEARFHYAAYGQPLHHAFTSVADTSQGRVIDRYARLLERVRELRAGR